MTVNGTTTPTIPADRAARRVGAVCRINAARKAGDLTDLDALFQAFDAGLLERDTIRTEAERHAEADAAAKDDGTRPPSRPNVPPKAVVDYAAPDPLDDPVGWRDVGGESGGA